MINTLRNILIASTLFFGTTLVLAQDVPPYPLTESMNQTDLAKVEKLLIKPEWQCPSNNFHGFIEQGRYIQVSLFTNPFQHTATGYFGDNELGYVYEVLFTYSEDNKKVINSCIVGVGQDIIFLNNLRSHHSTENQTPSSPTPQNKEDTF